MIVGLGQELPESVTVHWPVPSRATQVLSSVSPKMLYTVYENTEQSPGGRGHISEPYLKKIDRRITPKAPERPQIPIGDLASESRLTVVTTMATWCAACRRHLPQWAFLREALHQDELRIVALPGDASETSGQLADYVKRHRPAYELITDSEPGFGETLTQLAVAELGREGLPLTVVTNPEGEVLDVSWSPPSISKIRRLLSEQPHD
jgi:thiol-disulfide isomerase/thioredoxin